MTQCCNDFGNCTQGRDCPIRKQRMKEADDAYIQGGWAKLPTHTTMLLRLLRH